MWRRANVMGQAPISLDGNYIRIDGINVTGNGLFPLMLNGGNFLEVKNALLQHGREGIAGGSNDSLYENINTVYGPECELCGCLPGALWDWVSWHLFPYGLAEYLSADQLPRQHRPGVCDQLRSGTGDCIPPPTDNVVEQSTIYNNAGYGILAKPSNIVRNSMIYNNYVGIAGGISAYNNTLVNNNHAPTGGGVPCESGLWHRRGQRANHPQ